MSDTQLEHEAQQHLQPEQPHRCRHTLRREMMGNLRSDFGFVDGRYVHLRCGQPAEYPLPTVCTSCGVDTSED